MDRVAITGGAGEGKSTVLNVLRERGERVLDADSLVATLWEDPGFVCGLGLALGRDQITKEIVRNEILPDPALRRKLNDAFHAAVVKAILASDAEFVEVPLLLEACLQGHFSSVWVVAAGTAVQRERLLNRYANLDRVNAIISAQLPTSEKVHFADEIIRTNLPIESVLSHVILAVERWRNRAH